MKKIKKEHTEEAKKLNIYDFVGTITEQEADEMKKVIDETCGKIDVEAWKPSLDSNMKHISQ